MEPKNFDSTMKAMSPKQRRDFLISILVLRANSDREINCETSLTGFIKDILSKDGYTFSSVSGGEISSIFQALKKYGQISIHKPVTSYGRTTIKIIGEAASTLDQTLSADIAELQSIVVVQAAVIADQKQQIIALKSRLQKIVTLAT